MALKTKAVIFLVLSIIATIGMIAMLWVAYDNGGIIANLGLLAVTLLTIVMWCIWYLIISNYKESLNPKKKKYHKMGNRKESRRKAKK